MAKTLKVRPGLVYNVKAKMKATTNGKATQTKTNAKKRVAARKMSGHSNGAALPAALSDGKLIQAAELLKSCGGVEDAVQVLRTVARVADALRN